MELRSYQKDILDDLSFLSAIGLFMKTGTGKTITSLYKFKENKTPNLLVLCPSKVVTQWQEVIKDTINVPIIRFPKSYTAAQKDADIFKKAEEVGFDGVALVLSLESMANMPTIKYIVDDSWTVIVDESHKIKEWGTKRKRVKTTQAVLELADKTPYKVILTATPTQKDKGGYIDYYTQLFFLGYLTMSYEEFQRRYCIMKKIQPIGRPFPISIVDGYKNVKEIEEILKLCCRRYEMKYGEFEPQHIPIRLERPHSYVTLSKTKKYKELDLTNLTARRVAKKTLTSGVIHGHDKWKEPLTYKDNTIKIDWLQEFLEDTDETVVVFYQYNVELASLKELCEKLGKTYIVLNGQTKDKYYEIHNKKYEVVLAQFQAAGESIDGLQHRSHLCIYFAMPESSLAHKQALGRIDRDGQTQVPMYYYLIMDKTIDQDIYDMTQSKIEYSEATLNQLYVDKID